MNATILDTHDIINQTNISTTPLYEIFFLESDLSSILESAASVATALNVATQPLIVPKVEAPTLDDILMDHDGDYRNVTIKTEDGEQQQQQQQPSLLICPICGNEAGKHVHYGGRACTSCRAFFRRSVQHDAYKKFFCSSKNCKIDSKSWRSCKWCRFEKCLDSGLQPGILNCEIRKGRPICILLFYLLVCVHWGLGIRIVLISRPPLVICYLN